MTINTTAMRITGVLLLAIAAVTACGSAASTSSPAALSSSANSASAAACEKGGGSWDGTGCAMPPAPAEQTAASQTDPNGQTCDTLDSLGYCPGDDPTPTQTPVQLWRSGTGYSDFQQVQSDLNQISADSGNDDLAAVESDGTSLFQDASATAGGGGEPAAAVQRAQGGLRRVDGLRHGGGLQGVQRRHRRRVERAGKGRAVQEHYQLRQQPMLGHVVISPY
jgi:hypothetical protein